ncbi:MAG: hypothetical protein HC875_05605, partial [Anaerolineales bacterium]|nr:hypothetical protein [Anaerolineales bacterium]
EYAAARAGYQTALQARLNTTWRTYAATRLALLEAATDPNAAVAYLDATRTWQLFPAVPFSAALLPPAAEVTQQATQLRAILTANPADRLQLLGQLYTEQGRYDLALDTFAQIPPESPHIVSARAYMAYLQWRSNPEQENLNSLEALVLAYPNQPAAQTLLAVAQLGEAGLHATEPSTRTLALLPPDRPDTALAWALWYIQQRDYLQASLQYQEALRTARPSQVGRYALQAARFYLESSYEICTDGLPAAETAVRAMPNTADAWTVLAAVRYQCSEFAAAIEAAEQARTLAQQAGVQRADATFYLGAALAYMGDAAAARPLLIEAADLAPASIWRERAELLLADLDE